MHAPQCPGDSKPVLIVSAAADEQAPAGSSFLPFHSPAPSCGDVAFLSICVGLRKTGCLQSPVGRRDQGLLSLLIHSIHSMLNRGSPNFDGGTAVCSVPVFCATNSIWHPEQPGARKTHKWVATHQAVLTPADPIVARLVPKRGGFAPDRPIHGDQSTGVVPRSLCSVSQPIFVQRNLHRASPDVVGVNAQRPRYRAARALHIHGEV